MDNATILSKLKTLFDNPRVQEGFKTREDAISWANSAAPLLRLVSPQYYANFLVSSNLLNYDLSSFTLIPALRNMKNQIEMAIEELRLRIESESNLQDEMYFSENSFLEIQKNVARVMRQSLSVLRICDGYMDEKIIEELTGVTAPQIELLTSKQKGLFKVPPQIPGRKSGVGSSSD